VNSLPKTVTRQRRDCDLNPGPSAPESSTLTTQLPSHPTEDVWCTKTMSEFPEMNCIGKAKTEQIHVTLFSVPPSNLQASFIF